MTTTTHLLAVMEQWPRPVFVVIDGALLTDVPSLVAKADVFPRSLFIEHDNPATMQAGPWFASLDERHLANLMRIERIETAAVFWCGAVEEAVVFRHLRSINLVDAPRPAGAPLDPFAADPERVLFRHWDPSVMALVLPVLDPAQRARLFGPMDAIALYASSLNGVREAKRRDNWPKQVRGRIQLSTAQLDQIAGAMTDRSRRSIMSYLREASPFETAIMNEQALLDFVTESEVSGRGLGLVGERALSRWAYLMLISSGTIAAAEPARAYLAGGVANDRIDTLMLAIADEMDRRKAAT
jgi:hypothetical protein